MVIKIDAGTEGGQQRKSESGVWFNVGVTRSGNLASHCP